MLTPRLALQSLRNRLLATTLTVLSIAFSVALLVGIENIRNGLRESFTGTISGVDLIVGPRSSSVQLLLYSVFGMGSPTGNISWETYTHFRDHPAVAWTIPYSLGDNHRGFRVIGTTDAFYEHFRYREGRSIAFREGGPASTDHDVVVGSEVADRLEYALGDEIVVTHGMGAAGIMDHDDAPFRITGVLERTGTPVDRALYVTLGGIEAMHAGWEGGVPPMPSFAPPPEDENEAGEADDGAAAPGTRANEPPPASVEPAQITSFFVGTPTRFEMLGLQREVNDFQQEPLTALLPGIALAEMWRTVGYAEDGLRIVSFFVVIVGLLGMLVSLYTALDARRREMSIFRAIGAGPGRIVSLLVVESGFLAAAGALLGVLLVYGGILLSQGAVEERFGLLIPLRPLGTLELGYLAAVVVAGFIIGLVPAIKAYRTTLTDGLSPRS
ncbi:MAG: ABC transporter permease [Gemmatimonadales bacterium]|nr:MAG: ABC transporter permease [Gemmatimonadales bacterium]